MAVLTALFGSRSLVFNMGRIFSKKILEESRPWLAWGLLPAGPSVIAFSVAYAFSLILALSSGMSVLEATALFHTAISPVLEPLIAVAAGSWLLFWYLYLLAVPPAQALDHGRAVSICGYYTFKARLVAVGQDVAELQYQFSRLCSRQGTPLFKPQRLPILEQLHRHLTAKWSPGTNPLVVYQ